MPQIYPPLSYVHYIADSFSYMKQAIRFSMNSNGPGRHKSFTHIENRTGAVGREGELNTETKCTFTSASVGSSRRSYSFTSASVRIRAVHKW